MADSISAIASALASAREEGIIDAGVDEDVVTSDEVTEESDESSTEKTSSSEGETTETTTKVNVDDKSTEKTESGEKVEKTEVTEEDKGEKTPKDGDLDEYGLKAKVNGRENKIPYTKTRKIIDNQLAKGYAVVAKALGIDATKVTKDTVESVVTESLKDVPQMRERLKGFDDLEPIMANDGDAFIKILADANPDQYKKFLQVLEKDYVAPTKTTIVDEKDDPKPLPDMPVDVSKPDGPKTYSEEGWAKREAWVKRQLQREFNTELDKRFGPIEEERKAHQTREQQEQALHTRIETVMQHAKNLEGFEDIQEVAKEGLKEFAKLPLEFRFFASAWKAMRTKLVSDRQKMREEILAEIKKATVKSTSTPETTKVVTTPERRSSSEGSQSVIRAALNKARASGKL